MEKEILDQVMSFLDNSVEENINREAPQEVVKQAIQRMVSEINKGKD